jgi:1-acyl-sn-glycerol-3-phosphate acyltransferase
MDRKAINTAVEILESAERPLIVFPEGARSRHNDRLMALMDGVAFMARTAAKRRKKSSGGKVVVHPIAIRYFFRGNLEATLDPLLAEIEQRLSWPPQKDQPLLRRIARVGEALLTLKEIEYLGRARSGKIFERVRTLIDHVLSPLEKEYGLAESELTVIARVKRLRGAILPEMVESNLREEERERRWRQLAQCYYAQQMSYYPEDYLARNDNIPEHLLETVERFDEDLNDNAKVHGPLHVVIETGEAIEVSTDRPPKGEPDPLMAGIEHQLNTMLAGLAEESRRQGTA